MQGDIATGALTKTETHEGRTYRAATVDLKPFASLADGAKAVFGVSDATLRSELASVPKDERKICLRVANRNLTTVEAVDNKIAWIAWRAAGQDHFQAIAGSMTASQAPASRPLSTAEANAASSFGLSMAAVAQAEVVCRITSMSFGANGSVEGTFEIAAEDAGRVLAASGAETPDGPFEPLGSAYGVQLVSRTPPYAFRVKSPGQKSYFKVQVAAQDAYE